MKKCLLYGNCQTMAIKHSLENNPNFIAEYENIVAIEVHFIQPEDLPSILELVTEIDLFIHQPVKEGYKGFLKLGTDYLRSQLKPSCKVITTGGAYFTGYHPEVIVLKDAQENKIAGEVGDYHDFNLLNLFAKGKKVNETVDLILREDFYSPHYLNCNLDHTILELYRRDTKTDIKIAPFIQKYYRRHRLFHVINHPNQVIIRFISNEIFRLLGINYDERPSSLFSNDREVLDQTKFLIYPSVIKNLNLQFDTKFEYTIHHKTYTVGEAVEKFFDYYNRHQDLVALNLERYGEYYRISNIIQADLNYGQKQELVANDAVTETTAEQKSKTAVTSKITAEPHQEQLLELKSVKKCLEIGDAAQAERQWQQAINYYQKAIELNPNLEEKTYLKLKQAQQILGHSEDSIATYKAWIARNYLVEHQSKFIYCPIQGNAHNLVKKILLESSTDWRKFQESELNVDRYINQNKDKFYLNNFELLNNSNYFKFAILRNTYEKLVSVYLDLFVKPKQPANKQVNSIVQAIQEALNQEINPEQSITFEQFIDYLAISKDRDLEPILRSQSIYLAPELVQFDYIGCFEQLEVTIDYLQQKLAGKEVDLNIHIDRQQNSQSSATDKQLENVHNWYPPRLMELDKPPVTAQFYPAKIQEKVSYRYARDISMYEQYFDTVITPFDYSNTLIG